MPRTPPTRCSMAVVAAAILVSCGSDGGSGSGDLEAFCAELARPTSEQPELTEDFDAAMADMERIRDLAPTEIRGDVDVLLDSFREVEALGAEAESSGETGDDVAAVLEVLLSPEVIEASENLEAFGVDECGLDPEELNDSDSLEVGETGAAVEPVDEGPVGPVVSEAAAGVPDPLFDPFFDDEVDLGVASYEGAQYFLDVNYTDSPWRTRLGSWTFFGNDPPTLQVGGVDLSEDEAIEVCNAIAEYLAEFAPEGTITVSTYGQNADGTFGEEIELFATTADTGC